MKMYFVSYCLENKKAIPHFLCHIVGVEGFAEVVNNL